MNCWLREWRARQINDSPRLRRRMTMVPPGFKTETENLLRIAIDGVMSEFQMKVMPDESKEAAIRLLKAIQAPPSNCEKRAIDEEKEAEEVRDNLLQEVRDRPELFQQLLLFLRTHRN